MSDAFRLSFRTAASCLQGRLLIAHWGVLSRKLSDVQSETATLLRASAGPFAVLPYVGTSYLVYLPLRVSAPLGQRFYPAPSSILASP